MSRVAKNPISIPSGVEVNLVENQVKVKGPKGELSQTLHPQVEMKQVDNVISMSARVDSAWALAGTMRSLVNNMVVGVNAGYEKKLTIIGVGYRAAVKGKNLDLTLGFSHPVLYAIPEGISIECPSQTEVVIKGVDKQKVGQVAAEIRHFRPPEPYKGKGIRYTDEHVVRKEAKKK
ncbi:MAG: 50S ribosomal protein L6 [Acidiferrobacterales bacterium]